MFRKRRKNFTLKATWKTKSKKSKKKSKIFVILILAIYLEKLKADKESQIIGVEKQHDELKNEAFKAETEVRKLRDKKRVIEQGKEVLTEGQIQIRK